MIYIIVCATLICLIPVAVEVMARKSMTKLQQPLSNGQLLLRLSDIRRWHCSHLNPRTSRWRERLKWIDDQILEVENKLEIQNKH